MRTLASTLPSHYLMGGDSDEKDAPSDNGLVYETAGRVAIRGKSAMIVKVGAPVVLGERSVLDGGHLLCRLA